MSITFSPEYSTADIQGWSLTCTCGATTGTFDSYAEAGADPRVGTVLPDCEDATEEGWGMCSATPRPNDIERASVNVSNLNARHLLEVLGLQDEDGDLCGSDDAETFLGRILLAQAISPADAGTATLSHTTPHGATVVDCGRPEGYTQDRLDALRAVADEARTLGRNVTWA